MCKDHTRCAICGFDYSSRSPKHTVCQITTIHAHQIVKDFASTVKESILLWRKIAE